MARVSRVALVVLVVALSGVDSSSAAGRLVAAGPAWAGKALIWGEEHRDGSLTLVRRSGSGPRVIHRVPVPNEPDIEQRFFGLPGAVTASSYWTVFSHSRDRCKSYGDDVVGCASDSRIMGSY